MQQLIIILLLLGGFTLITIIALAIAVAGFKYPDTGPP
jgi:hypothetical protein